MFHVKCCVPWAVWWKLNKYSQIILVRKVRVKIDKRSLQHVHVHSDRSRKDAQVYCVELSVTDCCLKFQAAAASPTHFFIEFLVSSVYKSPSFLFWGEKREEGGHVQQSNRPQVVFVNECKKCDCVTWGSDDILISCMNIAHRTSTWVGAL